MLHLVLGCPVAQQVWHEILAWLRFTTPAPSNESPLLEWWTHAKQDTPKQLRKGLSSITLLTPWMIWKHLNNCVFENAQPSARTIISNTQDEARLWARAGAHGLRVILPATWDVH